MQVKRKKDTIGQEKRDDKEFVEYWKLKMRQLVIKLILTIRKKMKEKKLVKSNKGIRTFKITTYTK